MSSMTYFDLTFRHVLKITFCESDLKSQERCSGHKTFEIFVILNRLAKWLPISNHLLIFSNILFRNSQ